MAALRRKGLSAEQAALLDEMVAEKLCSIANREFSPYLSVIQSWQDDLDAAGEWFTAKTIEYDRHTDTVIEQFTIKEGLNKLRPHEIVEHDHTYCLRPDTITPIRNNNIFVPHNCDFACWKKGIKVQEKHNYNPLELPLHLGWQRVKMNRMNGGGVDIYYIAPCGRRLRSLDEVQLFLDAVGNGISITLFTFDPSCSLRTTPSVITKPSRVLYYCPDLSKGKEKIPVSVVNTHSSCGPDPFEYICERTHEADVHIPTEREFLVCCSCTDNCANRSRCECWQLTLQESNVIGGESKFSVGYSHQRLNRPQHSAIYECNQYCQCGSSCTNRVVQNGLQHRLQVFHTGKSLLGWGLRALDDIPKGSFICTYVGNIYTELNAEKKASTYGDEYFADLDYIEVVEHHKENYEAEVAAFEAAAAADQLSSSSSTWTDSEDDSSSFLSFGRMMEESGLTTPTEIHVSQIDFDAEMDIIDLDDIFSDSDTDSTLSPPHPSLASALSSPSLSRNNSLNKDLSSTNNTPTAQPLNPRPPLRIHEAAASAPSSPSHQSSDVVHHQLFFKRQHDSSIPASPTNSQTSAVPDFPPRTTHNSAPVLPSDRYRSFSPRLLPRMAQDSVSTSPSDTSSSFVLRLSPTRTLSIDSGPPSPSDRSSGFVHPFSPRRFHESRTRQFFGQNFSYIMDAKTKGNIGRYINHSCAPNMFVLNVFIDTHDLRFPWVAFFTKKRIKAMQELTWDYNYEVGSVENKHINCLCGAPQCKGRLL